MLSKAGKTHDILWSMRDRVKLLKQIVCRAGKAICDSRFLQIGRQKEDVRNIVTKGDLESERIILSRIKRSFPKDKILSEETEAEVGVRDTKEYLWVVDPIDGSINYKRERNYCAVAVGITRNREVLAGAAFNPFTRDLYFAEKEKGAYLNGKRIFCSKEDDIFKASVMTSTYYDKKLFLPRLKPLLKNKCFGRLFIEGSSVMAICELASGSFDLYFNDVMKPWDNAASFIIAQESGATATDFKGRKIDFFSPEAVVGNEKLVKKFVRSIER